MTDSRRKWFNKRYMQRADLVIIEHYKDFDISHVSFNREEEQWNCHNTHGRVVLVLCNESIEFLMKKKG